MGKQKSVRPPGTKAQALTEMIIIRLEMGLTQKQLAEKLGVSTWTVMRYEREDRPIPATYKLALEQVYQSWLNRCYFAKV